MDQIGDGFGLHEIELAVEKRPLGELARLGETRTIVHQGFQDELRTDPATLLRQIAAFLDISPDPDWVAANAVNRVNAGPGDAIPPRLAAALSSLYEPQLAELAGSFSGFQRAFVESWLKAARQRAE